MFRAKLHKLRPEATQNCFTNSFGFSKAVLRRSRGSKKNNDFKLFNTQSLKEKKHQESWKQGATNGNSPLFTVYKSVCHFEDGLLTPLIRVYFLFLHTLNLLRNNGDALETRSDEEPRHLSIRMLARLWESTLRVFLEYIEIIGSGAFKMKRK